MLRLSTKLGMPVGRTSVPTEFRNALWGGMGPPLQPWHELHTQNTGYGHTGASASLALVHEQLSPTF